MIARHSSHLDVLVLVVFVHLLPNARQAHIDRFNNVKK